MVTIQGTGHVGVLGVTTLGSDLQQGLAAAGVTVTLLSFPDIKIAGGSLLSSIGAPIDGYDFSFVIQAPDGTNLQTVIAAVSLATGNPANAAFVANPPVSFTGQVEQLVSSLVGVGQSAAQAASVLPWVILGGVVLAFFVLSSGRKTNLTQLL